MNEKWLKCVVGEGMFSDELVVTVAPKLRSGSDPTSVFVPKEMVRRDEVQRDQGLLRVLAFLRGTTWWAILPTEYQMTIPVSEVDLVSA